MFCFKKNENPEEITVKKEDLRKMYALFVYFNRIKQCLDFLFKHGLEFNISKDIQNEIDNCGKFLASIFLEEYQGLHALRRSGKGFHLNRDINESLIFDSLPQLNDYIDETIVQKNELQKFFIELLAHDFLDLDSLTTNFPNFLRRYKKIFLNIKSQEIIDEVAIETIKNKINYKLNRLLEDKK